MPRETTLRAIESIKLELRERIEFFYQNNKLVETQRIEQRTCFDRNGSALAAAGNQPRTAIERARDAVTAK